MKEKIEKYIKTWKGRGYFSDIPDEAPSELEAQGLAPSYRLVAHAILKNDHPLKTLGYSGEKTEWYYTLRKLAKKQEKAQLELFA